MSSLVLAVEWIGAKHRQLRARLIAVILESVSADL